MFNLRTNQLEIQNPFCWFIRVWSPVISTNLSPFAIFSGQYEIARALFSPLLLLNPSKGVIPYVIEKLSYDDKKRAYIFHIRRDVFFHDNKQLKAEDFEFSLLRGMQKQARPMFSEILAGIEGYDEVRSLGLSDHSECEGIKVLSDFSIQIQLKEKNPLFIRYFTRTALSLVHRDLFQSSDLYKWKTVPIGIGAYVFSEYDTLNNKLILLKHKKFFSNLSQAPDKIEFTTCQEEADIVTDMIYINDKFLKITPSESPIMIACEHYSLDDDDVFWLMVRKKINDLLINAGIKDKKHYRNLPFYEKADTLLPKKILNKKYQCNRKNINVKNFDKKINIPTINIVMNLTTENNYILKNICMLAKNILVKAGFVVCLLKTDNYRNIPENHEHYMTFTTSTFNYLHPDNLGLFFAESSDIYRSNSCTLREIRELIKEARNEVNLKQSIDKYLTVCQKIEESELMLPLAHTCEYSYINTRVIEQHSFYNKGVHPFFENLRPA